MDEAKQESQEKVIAGRYRVIEKLAVGGIGVVYKAFDLRMKKDVALKVLNSPNLTDEVIVRFQREAKCASQLLHRNLISIFDFGITGDREPYMVMEFVKGKTLEQMIESGGRLTPENAVAVLLQICSAMSHAHQNGVIHRDLKTSNIMLEDSTRDSVVVKILDFGVVKLTGENAQVLTQAGHVVGTANYMSPEQAKGLSVDPRSDVYSLGCVMYEILTGARPFDGETYLETLSKHINEPPPTLAGGAQGVVFPHYLEQGVARALAKAPVQRFQSMEEFAEALVEGSSETGSKSVRGANADSERTSRFPVHAKTVTRRLRLGVKLALVVLTLVTSWFTYVKYKQIETRNENKNRFLAKEYGYSWLIIPEFCHGEDLDALKDFKDVKHLRSESTHLSDGDLKYITCLPLEVLNLSNSDITNDGLRSIRKMKTLKCLIVEDNKRIDDDGVSNLTNHENLQILSLSGTNITDGCAPYLCTLADLHALDISDAPGIGESTIIALKSLPKLKTLAIGATGVTGGALHHFQKFRELRLLLMNNLHLTDDDIMQLNGAKLNAILLNGNKDLTDRGLENLSHVKRLGYISVEKCPKITLPALLTFLANYNCSSDNDYYYYVKRPESLTRDRWGFYLDPVYYDLGYQKFIDRFGTYYGYSLDMGADWVARVSGYLKDKTITSKLSKETISTLSTVVKFYSQTEDSTAMENMMKQSDVELIEQKTNLKKFDAFTQ